MQLVGFDVTSYSPGHTPLADAVQERPLRSNVKARVGSVKRRFLPMPLDLGARDAQMASKIKARHFDMVHISALNLVPYARLTGAPLWLDFMDVWSEVALLESRYRGAFARHSARSQALWLRLREQRIASRADMVTAAGWSDVETLRRMGIDAEWVPTPLPDSEFGPVPREERGSRTAGFIANFAYWPNVDAYDFLIANWLPALRRAGWHVLVAGIGSEALTAPNGVEIMGPVGEVNQFYARIDASVAPIRMGGGIKVKVLESLAKGIPVIGTRFAFDGFPPGYARFFAVEEGTGISPRSLDMLERFDPSEPALNAFRSSVVTQTLGEFLESRVVIG